MLMDNEKPIEITNDIVKKVDENLSQELGITAVVVKKLKNLMLTYDLLLIQASAERDIRIACMNQTSHDTRKKPAKKYIVAKIEKERLDTYIEELLESRDNLLQGVEIILEKYNIYHKRIFVDYFLKGQSVETIAEKEKLSNQAVENIVDRIKKDILDFYSI